MSSVFQKGRHLNDNSSGESKFLYNILQAIKNNGGISYNILTALGGGNAAVPSLPNHYNLLSSQTLTLAATSKFKSISFQVTKGSVSVTINGTAITYPVGTSATFNSVSWLGYDVAFSVPGSSGDGNNAVFIQTIN